MRAGLAWGIYGGAKNSGVEAHSRGMFMGDGECSRGFKCVDSVGSYVMVIWEVASQISWNFYIEMRDVRVMKNFCMGLLKFMWDGFEFAIKWNTYFDRIIWLILSVNVVKS